MTEGPLARLLPLACLAAAVCLFASELMTIFEFTPPGGEAICDQSASDRHGNAQAVIAAFAIGAVLIAVFAASKPAATAVAIAGVIALLVFLIVDLRHAGAVGTINDSCGAIGDSFFDAEVVPQAGFWLEMVGALALAVTGVALATLTPEQLTALRPRIGRWESSSEAPARPRTETDVSSTNTEPREAARELGEDQPRHPGRPRSRPRQRR